MSNKFVIDSSAIIALLEEEDGFDIVEKHLANSIISSVNFSEVIAVINRKVIDTKAAEESIKLLKNTLAHIVDFDSEQAYIAAMLDKTTKKQGLSFGDRACLALAKYKNLPALTADKVWKKLKVDVEIQIIR